MVYDVTPKGGPGKVDPGNSTSVVLDPSEVWVGNTIDVLLYPLIFVSVYTDQASAVDGLSIQQSIDGTNWDFTDDYSIPAGGSKQYSIPRFVRYLRVVYINGGILQGAFRLQTILSINTKPSSHRIKDEIVGDDDAELVKAAITGENGDGMWHNVGVTEDGDLTISDNSNGLAIAQGNVTGSSFIHKFGNAPDFDTTDGLVTVWDGADDGDVAQMNYVYSSTAIIDSLSSSIGGDTQNIEVEGLDGDYNVITQIITLTGQTRKALDTNLLRVYRMRNVNATDNTGHIYCYENTALTTGVPIDTTKIRAIIQPGNNQTLMTVYTIPAGKTGYMRDWYASTAGANRNSNYNLEIRSREFGKVFQLKHVGAISDNASSAYQHKYDEPEIFLEKTDIEIRVEVLAAGVTGASFSAGFDMVLIDD